MVLYTYLWLYPRENYVIPEVRKRRGGWPGFEVFVWRRLTSCETSVRCHRKYKNGRIKVDLGQNNLYLLTRPINVAYCQLLVRDAAWWTGRQTQRYSILLQESRNPPTLCRYTAASWRETTRVADHQATTCRRRVCSRTGSEQRRSGRHQQGRRGRR